MKALIAHPDYQLFELKGKSFCSSLQVAETFGKRHDHVLRDIRQIIANCPESFHVPNFGETFFDVPGPNGATRKEPLYLLTRDGFSILAFGFTGKKAMQFKIDYIRRFNEMESLHTIPGRHPRRTRPRSSATRRPGAPPPKGPGHHRSFGAKRPARTAGNSPE